MAGNFATPANMGRLLHVSELRDKSPKALADRAALLIMANRCDTRDFDDCFEMGNGREVIRVLLENWGDCLSFQHCCQVNSTARARVDLDYWRRLIAEQAA